MSEHLSTAAGIVDVPAGAVPTGGIVVVGYIDADGDEKLGLRTVGDTAHSNVIGLMQMASHLLIHEANPTRCEQDDD